MKNKRIFITGIPTAGKSFLGKKLAEKIGGICVSIDDIRENLSKDERYKKWVNFYLDQDEYIYYATTNPDKQWNNLVKQSEGFWPGILKKIREYDNEVKPLIIEGTNILPHLAHNDLDMPGITIIGKSFEEVLERNIKDPRWGKTEELQKLEASSFFNIERPHFKSESEKYGYKVFETPDDAWNVAIKLLS